MLTEQQERDLRDAFEVTLSLLDRQSIDVARIDTRRRGEEPSSAVVLVVGAESTKQVMEATDKIMERWDQAEEVRG